jgi:thiamine pyrophosphate-dependent acetolactate synthase large subunit-like protein
MAKNPPSQVDRRRFLAGVAVTGAAAVTASESANAALPPAPQSAPRPSALRPGMMIAQAETRTPPEAPPHPGLTHGKPGSDFMLDVIKTLNIDYVITNPASSCRGLHESIINYGGNKAPELLTAMHEETATGMAHGYFKVSGRPLAALCHGTVGLQHAAMGVYNAWCDRAPVILLTGNAVDAVTRRPGVPTLHSVQDPASLVRDFTKWDDQPGSLQHFAESMVRAYRVAMTPPLEPVLITLDEELQEHAIEEGARLSIPKLVLPAPPRGEDGAVREAARLLAAAEYPVIVADRAARSQAGVDAIKTLAELLGAPVVDQTGRMNMPNMHYLYRRGGGDIPRADVILGLELTDYWGTVNEFVDSAHATQGPIVRQGARLISIGTGDIYIRSNYQDFQRFQPVDIAMAADVEATLPALIEAVRSEMTQAARANVERRTAASRTAYAQGLERTRAEAAANAWNASPISCARLCAEMWGVLKNEDWGLTSRDQTFGSWPRRLWNFEKHHQWIGGPGGHGQGYSLPASVGAALAHRAEGRIAVSIPGDGDAMYTSSALWTAAHHDIPLLAVIHNNRGYHQELMHVQRMCSWRSRGMQNFHIGTTIERPYVDFAKHAESLGVVGIGPIENPNDLGPALRRAVDIVKSGRPVLIDVVTQPR